MISPKEVRMHIYSVFALVLVLISFFILGGGSSHSNEVYDDGVSVNVSIPDAREGSLAENRFDASKREENRTQESERVDKLQQNSFELFNRDSVNSPDVGSQTVSIRSSGKKSAPILNNYTYKGGAEADAGANVIGKDVAKKKVMKRKREQIERELGINLSDYGYDKYKDDGIQTSQVETTDHGEDEVPLVPSEKSGFYGLDSAEEMVGGDIEAVIHGDHNNVTSGSIIKMRILKDIEVDGVKVPVNTFIYGKLSFKNGRATIQISNINYRRRILKFTGSIYDNDGFEGLYVPDNVISDTKNKVVSDIVGGVDIDISSKSKMLKSASSSVTNTLKSAIQGSVREAKISISSNYLITIKRKRK